MTLNITLTSKDALLQLLAALVRLHLEYRGPVGYSYLMYEKPVVEEGQYEKPVVQ